MRVAASLSPVSSPPSDDARRHLLSLTPVSPLPLAHVACSKVFFSTEVEEELEERGHGGLVLLENSCDERWCSSSPSNCNEERLPRRALFPGVSLHLDRTRDRACTRIQPPTTLYARRQDPQDTSRNAAVDGIWTMRQLLKMRLLRLH